MKRILITGAAGFIGLHLALFLKEKGAAVIGLDNFSAYYDLSLKEARASLLAENKVPVIKGDILESNLVKKTLDDHGITHVVHLAAQAGVRYSLVNPQLYIDTNISGLIPLLEALKDRKGVKLVFASSSSVYGVNKKTPFAEDDPTDQPANLYGATKKADELIAFAYHNLYQIPMVGLRYFTVYGPFGRPDMAYFLFTKKILAGEPISLFHQGKMERDFTFVDDIVRGTAAALDYNTPFEIFNLGNHRPVSVLSMISILESLLGRKAICELYPESKGEALITFADITKSHEKLGFTPRTSLEQGLEKFVAWYRQFYKTAHTGIDLQE